MRKSVLLLASMTLAVLLACGVALAVDENCVEGQVCAGTDGDDRLIGTPAPDTMRGLDGEDDLRAKEGNDDVNGGAHSDELHGQEGDDELAGAESNDYLVGGVGDDAVSGGTGNDFYRLDEGWGQDTVSGEPPPRTIREGDDRIDLTEVGTDSTINLVAGSGDEVSAGVNTVNWSGDFIENAGGGSGHDTITGNNVVNFLDGHQMSDVLIGGYGGDRLDGGLGNDLLIGGRAVDHLNGGPGNDSLRGGSANDFYDFVSGWGADRITREPTTSRNKLDFYSLGCDNDRPECVTANLTIRLIPSASSPEVTDGTNTLNWEGQVIENVFSGLGNDTITGNSDSNVLGGSGGNDTINSARSAAEAGGADDYLSGGDGNDTINSVAGAQDFASAPELDGAQGDDTINAANGGLDLVYCGNHRPGKPPDDDVANVDPDDWVAPNFFEPSRSSCETINIVSE